MKTKRLFMKPVSLTIVILLVSTTVISVCAAGTGVVSAITKKSSTKNDAFVAINLSKQYGISKDELLKSKNELGSWDAVIKNILKSNNQGMPKDKLLALYEQGYSIQDIEKAQQLAQICKSSPEELLAIKGKAGPDNTKSWEEIANQFKVDLRPPEEKLGISEEKYADLQKQGFDYITISEMYGIARQYNKEVDEIIAKYKNGKSLKQIGDEYWEASLSSKSEEERKKSIEIKKKLDEMAEQSIIKQYNITPDEISACNKAGFQDITDISTVKRLAQKYKTTVDNVLQLKSKLNNWKDVIIELEVAADEK